MTEWFKSGPLLRPHLKTKDNAKVSQQSVDIKCYNRFQPLQVDNVAESNSSQDTGVVFVKNLPLAKPTKTQAIQEDASINDASDNLILDCNSTENVHPLTKYEIPLMANSKTHNYKSVLPNCPKLKN